MGRDANRPLLGRFVEAVERIASLRKNLTLLAALNQDKRVFLSNKYDAV